ncbi:hypothetical protein [Sigmofec virus UA08Rod_7256]|uniref:Uncharacterized protein n=1 Tax=Sigmofec virus UA08Rod_7256 TaxID=2929244 RepID=A0A976R7T9_9VIRU|nr:hypothetical protein [Sigmofec virus UA08Rod_7256]
MKKVSKWAEPVSTLPSRTRRGEAQTAEQLFKMFGMDIPTPDNAEDYYEFEVGKNTLDEMFETKTNEVVDHRELLDVMEQEFNKHASSELSRSEAVDTAPTEPAHQPISQSVAHGSEDDRTSSTPVQEPEDEANANI